MARETPQISLDSDGNVVELVAQPVDENSFQVDLDNAQNAKNDADAAAAIAQEAADSATAVLTAALETQEGAAEELSFQEGRKSAYDEAVRLRGDVASEAPADADASDLGESDADFSGAPGESTDIPVSIAE